MSIHIEDLTVRFKNGVTAINHANLNIPNGIFGLLGENGAGKTTIYFGSEQSRRQLVEIAEAFRSRCCALQRCRPSRTGRPRGRRPSGAHSTWSGARPWA